MLDWWIDRLWLRFTYSDSKKCITLYHGKHGLITWCMYDFYEETRLNNPGIISYFVPWFNSSDGWYNFGWLGVEATLY